MAHVHPRHPDPCSPSPGPHPEHTNPGLRPAVGCGDPRWHRFSRVGIRWRAHTAHTIEDQRRSVRMPTVGAATEDREALSPRSLGTAANLTMMVPKRPHMPKRVRVLFVRALPPCWMAHAPRPRRRRPLLHRRDWSVRAGWPVRTGMFEIDSNAPEVIIARDRLDTTCNIEV